MVCQVEIDDKRYLTGISLGGLVEGGIDIPEATLSGIDREKMRAYRLSEDGQAMIFDPDKWAEIDPENCPVPPTPENRIAELEAALNILLKGEAT